MDYIHDDQKDQYFWGTAEHRRLQEGYEMHTAGLVEDREVDWERERFGKTAELACFDGVD